MRRCLVLGSLLAIGALSLTVSAYQGGAAQPAAMVVTVDQVRPNLWVLRGGGGNTAVFAGTNGVVVVDTKLAGWGEPILAKIKELTPKAVTTIINTHSHGDHVSGNVAFPGTVDIVSHVNTKANIEKWPGVYGLTNVFPNVVKESGGKGMPTKTFTDKMSLGSGADAVELYYFGRAHTSGDAFVVFPALRVMHTGDAFANKNIPIMDKNAGGSGVEYAQTLMKAANGVQNIDTIITGHAPTTMTMADLRMFAEFVGDFVSAVREAGKMGKTADDVVTTWKTPAKYTDWGMPQPASVKNAAQVILDEIK